jgi:flagellar basal body-associated protein FliL
MGEGKEGLKILVVAFLVLIACAGIYYAWLALQPAYLKQERTNYKSSYQYSEAKDTELLNFVTTYNNLETRKQEYIAENKSASLIDSIETQQEALSDQIHNDAELAPDQSKLPDSVKTFLSEHPKNGG